MRPEQWSASQLAAIKGGTVANTKGIPLKFAFGSDFPYRDLGKDLLADYDGVGVRPSLAQGGLSNVWGAAMLPYCQQDIADWPITVSDLARHYADVLTITGLSARRDDLEHFFPLYHEQGFALNLSRQAQTMLAGLEKHRSGLARAGVRFGQARIAVQAARKPGDEDGCRYCGLCMYGCPYGYIYNSQDTLRQWLRREPNFSHQPDIIVTKVQESATNAFIEGHRRMTGEPVHLQADRVFLAAGAIPTAQILLRSLALYGKTLWMKDSQYFLLPLALAQGSGDVRHESLQTLSQLFLEISDPRISPHLMHLQAYSYNELIGQTVRQALGPLAKPSDVLARLIECRLLVMQGFLHSAHSSRIAIELTRGDAGGPDRLRLKPEPNPEALPTIRRAGWKLLRLSRQLGGIPVLPMMQIAEPGRGFHTGGTFPMRLRPGPLEADLLGRPHGWTRIHVVDSSVLPSIPATTITFSVMANAHRIGWESADLT
jgi:choline dehydrogenase-like flavoprotein